MESTFLTLRVAPKASKDAIVGWHGSALKIKVRAAPEDGCANAAVVEVLARALDLPRSAIVLEGGLASRDKRVRLQGISADNLQTRLAALTSAPAKADTQ